MKGERKDRVTLQISLMHGENGSAMNNTCNVRTCLLNIYFQTCEVVDFVDEFIHQMLRSST